MSTEITMISPEGLEIAEQYLKNGSDTQKTALAMGLPTTEVARYLAKREVKQYIDQLYFESGFRNRERMGNLMDEVLAAKLEEMDETGLGSSKDITEIMKLSHDMKMKEMEMEIKLMNAKNSSGPQIQVNNQTNNNYNSLLDKIMEAGK